MIGQLEWHDRPLMVRADFAEPPSRPGVGLLQSIRNVEPRVCFSVEVRGPLAGESHSTTGRLMVPFHSDDGGS